MLQGKYGNVADQWISARIVLANGTAITVSDDANPDLWWAIRGAGHNFGVVTSIVSKVYTAPKGDWAWETLIFTHDKVEKIYEAINEFARQTETIEEVMNYSAYIRIPDVDPRHVSLSLA